MTPPDATAAAPGTASAKADGGGRVGPVMRLEVFAARALLALLRRLGPVRSSDLGGALCRTLGPLLPVSRVAHDNLRLALPELDRRRRARIVRGVWDNLGRTLCELPHVGALQRDTREGPGWEIVGEAHLLRQAQRGGAVIFVSGHLGNWEVLPAVVARYGLGFASMYRAVDNPALDALIRDLRAGASGVAMPLFAKGARGARAALGHIARGGNLGLLVDQKMNDGVPARFFGHPAMTASAAAVMALRYQAVVIPGHIERLGPARFRLVCEAPLSLPDSGDRQRDQLALTQSINDVLEGWIRAKPESWLWLHRRWPKALMGGRAGRRRNSDQ